VNAVVEAYWTRIEPLLQQALVHARGTHEVEDVLKALAEDRLQLWVGEASVAVSEILSFPRLRALNVFLAAGKMSELRACLPGMEAYARGKGCSRLMFAGRLDDHDGRKSGWEKFMPDCEPTHISLFKELA
jgi:hypothetical protein